MSSVATASSDLTHLKHKVDCGLDFVITQLFFDNADYFAFVERARARGIRVPIIPGIMPITNLAQIERFTAMCGARIPQDLRARLEEVRHDDEAVRAVGIDHATAQCRETCSTAARPAFTSTRSTSPPRRAPSSNDCAADTVATIITFTPLQPPAAHPRARPRPPAGASLPGCQRPSASAATAAR